MTGDNVFLAFALPNPSDGDPRGVVAAVTVLHEEPDGQAAVRYVETGTITKIGGPYCSSRLCATEAEAWAFCAQQLRAYSARLDSVAAECAAKARVEVIA